MRRTEGRRTREIEERMASTEQQQVLLYCVEDRGICCTHCSRSSSLHLDFKTTITVGIRYVLPICRSTCSSAVCPCVLLFPDDCCCGRGRPGTRAVAFLAGLQSGPSLSAHRLRDIELYIEEREEVSGAVGSCPL